MWFGEILLELPIENYDSNCNWNRTNQDYKVECKKFEQSAWTHFLFLDEKSVWLLAAFAENTLRPYYLCSNTIRVQRFQALTSLNKLCTDTKIHKVAGFILEIAFHVEQKLGQRSFRQTFYLVFVLVKDYWNVALAQYANVLFLLLSLCVTFIFHQSETPFLFRFLFWRLRLGLNFLLLHTKYSRNEASQGRFLSNIVLAASLWRKC